MADGLTVKTLLLTGFVLLGLGVERLLNAYLLGGGPSVRARLALGTFCVITGGLIAATAYVRSRTRR